MAEARSLKMKEYYTSPFATTAQPFEVRPHRSRSISPAEPLIKIGRPQTPTFDSRPLPAHRQGCGSFYLRGEVSSSPHRQCITPRETSSTYASNQEAYNNVVRRCSSNVSNVFGERSTNIYQGNNQGEKAKVKELKPKIETPKDRYYSQIYSNSVLSNYKENKAKEVKEVENVKRKAIEQRIFGEIDVKNYNTAAYFQY